MSILGGPGTPRRRLRCNSPVRAPSSSAFPDWHSPSTSTSPSGASRTRSSLPTCKQQPGRRAWVSGRGWRRSMSRAILADLARCREEFPDLRILAGIEAGEPHLFPASVAAVLSAGDFERVLGSLHGIVVDGTLTGIDSALFAKCRCARGDAPLLRRTRRARRRVIGVQCAGALRLPTAVLADRHAWARTTTPTSKRSTGRCSARWRPRGVRWRSTRAVRWPRSHNCVGGGRKAATRCPSAATRISRSGRRAIRRGGGCG